MSGLPLDLVDNTRRESEFLDLGNVDDLLTPPNDLYPLFKRTVFNTDFVNSFADTSGTLASIPSFAAAQNLTLSSKEPAVFAEFIAAYDFTNSNSNPICWSAVDAPQIAAQVVEASTASSSSTTSIELEKENKTLTKEQTLLRAKINHLEKSWKEISELNGIHYSEDSIRDIFSTIKTEYDSDPSSIDKYVQEGYLSKDELVALFKKPHLDMDVTVLSNQQKLLRARIDHPKKTWKEISELIKKTYSENCCSMIFSRIKSQYNLDANSIDRYVKEGYLTKVELERLFKSFNSNKGKPFNKKKEASLKKQQKLLRARIDHPKMTWKEIVNLNEVCYTQKAARNVFSAIKVNYKKDPSSIDQYVNEGYLTKAEIENFFNVSNQE